MGEEEDMDSDVQVGCGLLGGSGLVPSGGPGGQLGVEQGEDGQEDVQAQQLGGGEGGGGVPRDVGQPSGHLEEAQPCLQACQEVQDQRPPLRRSSRGGAGCRCSHRCSPGISRTPLFLEIKVNEEFPANNQFLILFSF